MFRDMFLPNPETGVAQNVTTEDDEYWEEIEKDVRRTRPEMHFFFQPVDN
jgi:hypothetical protein